MTKRTKKTTAAPAPLTVAEHYDARPMQQEFDFHASTPAKTIINYPCCRIQVSRLSEPMNPTPCDCPEKIARYWADNVATAADYCADQERVVVVMLNTKLAAIGWQTVGVGTINEVSVRVAEILRAPIVMGAHSFVLMHCHPSGDCLPSQADIDLTRRLNEGARTIGVRLQDHVIVPGDKSVQPAHAKPYCSFREMGLL